MVSTLPRTYKGFILAAWSHGAIAAFLPILALMKREPEYIFWEPKMIK